MPTFDTSHQLLQPGETGLFVFTDGTHFTFEAGGSGSTGSWVISPNRQVDRVVVFKQQLRDGQRFVELFTARHDGVIAAEDGRYTIRLLDVQLAGSTDHAWQEFVEAGQNPVRYVTRPMA